MGRSRPTRLNCKSIEGGLLLGVQLDDQVHCDVEVDVFLCRQSNDLTGKVILITVEPLGSSNKSIIFLQLLEEVVGNALLADSNDVADLHLEGGDVNAAAVDGEVTVVHQLTSLTAGVGEAQTINNVIQTTLAVAQQGFTSVALAASSLLVVITELLLLDTVNKLDLLLLGQLSCVLRLLSSSLAAGVLVGSLGITHCGRRNTQRSATLQYGLHIFSHNLNSSYAN